MNETVSKAYRQLPAENAPERLNNAVLEMAADEVKRGRSPLSLRAAWTTRLALAATFALSLAVVFEYTRLPENAANISAPLHDSVSEEFRPKDTQSIDNAREMARLRSGSDSEVAFEPATTDDAAEDKLVGALPAAAPAATVAIPDARVEEVEQEIALSAAEKSADSDSDQLPATPERQDIARFSISSSPLLLEKKQADERSICADDVRERRDDWLACIKELNASGNFAAADKEYEEFVLRFPEE